MDGWAIQNAAISARKRRRQAYFIKRGGGVGGCEGDVPAFVYPLDEGEDPSPQEWIEGSDGVEYLPVVIWVNPLRQGTC
jgi:hypothetical protein